MVAESEIVLKKNAESVDAQLWVLKGNIIDTLSLVENMKSKVHDGTTEGKVQELASETLLQLESAKRSIQTLRSDGSKAIEAYNSIVLELEKLKGRANFLENLVRQMSVNVLEKNMLQAKSRSIQRETELEAEVARAKVDMQKLKAELMDKENELHRISEENEDLKLQLQASSISCPREFELTNELKGRGKYADNLKASLMEKEMKLQYVLDENKMLNVETKKRDGIIDIEQQLEAARAGERDAKLKLGLAMEEVVKSNSKFARVNEQLKAAKASNAELEVEFRRLKIQSSQWRKAAETAVAIISGGTSGKFLARTASLDRDYYYQENEDGMIKKKNANVMKKIGVLWKKQ